MQRSSNRTALIVKPAEAVARRYRTTPWISLRPLAVKSGKNFSGSGSGSGTSTASTSSTEDSFLILLISNSSNCKTVLPHN
jgi:hypothetical protein